MIETSCDEIVPGLWQGDQFAGAWAAREGFDMNVNLTPHTTNMSIPASGKYVIWPIGDGPLLPDLDKAHTIAERIANEVKAGKRVMVHCAAGLNRSGLVVSLAVRLIKGCNGAEAVEIVRRKRDGALFNETFAGYVRTLPRPKRPRART